MVSNLADVLWKITALHEKINAGNKIEKQIPAAFERFSGFRSSTSNNGNGLSLVSKDLLAWVIKLEYLLLEPPLRHTCWATTVAAIKKLNDALVTVRTRLEEQAKRTRDQRARAEPAVDFINNISLEIFPAVPEDGAIDTKYDSLNEALSKVDPFTLVPMEELMQEVVAAAALSSTTYVRRMYRENIALNAEVHVFTYVTGNKYTLSWAFWVPEDMDRGDPSYTVRTGKLYTKAEELAPLYASRAERREFQQIYSAAHLSSKPDLHAMRQIFIRVRGDLSAEAFTALDSRIQQLLDAGDPELAIALTKMNGRPNSPAFEPFWEAAGSLINSGLSAGVSCHIDLYKYNIGHIYILSSSAFMPQIYVCNANRLQLIFLSLPSSRLAAQERRHGHSCVTFLPFAISIPDFHSKILKKLLEDHSVADVAGLEALGIKVPSESWLSFQMHPQHSLHLSSLRYTGRLPIRWMVQQRSERKFNEDSSYCYQIQQYQHAHAVDFKARGLTVVYIGVDDKCKINVGDPGCPIGAVARNRGASLVPNGVDLVALDHDFHKFNLTPSVFAVSEIPDNATDSFYNMDVTVIVKCSIQQPSKPFRHAAELAQVLRRQFPDKMPCIVIMRSDAGPDRNTRRAAVQVSLLALFLNLDCDYMLVAMNAAGRSYLNEVERCMSALNLALQNCAFARTHQVNPVELEAALKSCNSMASVRDLLVAHPEWADAIMDSLKEPIDIIKERFSSCTFGGKDIVVALPATPEDIAEMVQMVSGLLQEGLEPEKVTMLELLKNTTEVMRDIRKYHMVCRHYTVELIKANPGVEGFCDGNCAACKAGIFKPVRSPPSAWSKVVLLPTPSPDPSSPVVSKAWLPYSDALKEVRSESHRPGLRGQLDPKTDLKSQPFLRAADNPPEIKGLLTGSHVRGTVSCEECAKPRLLFSQYQLAIAQEEQLEVLRAERGYTCGDVLVPPLPQQSGSAPGTATETLDLTREENTSGRAALEEEEEGAGARENDDATNGDGRETPAVDVEIEDNEDDEEEGDNAAVLQASTDPYNKLRAGWKDGSTAVGGGRRGKKTGNGVYTRLDSTSRTNQIMRCSDPVERLFYNRTVTVIPEEKKKTVCFFCGGEDGVVDETLEKVYRAVLPICPSCSTSGLTAPCYKRLNEAEPEDQAARKSLAVERGGGRGRGGSGRGGRRGG